ncbi:hypothetical protein ACO2Q9_19325 [Variovorax sp. VNK109]|jgi:hypothetical protein|uniref:hypothetical protein n=1 Tax=Variovorax sp. VNK109 TaxID=3400919 RepID=UPI003C0107DE
MTKRQAGNRQAPGNYVRPRIAASRRFLLLNLGGYDVGYRPEADIQMQSVETPRYVRATLLTTLAVVALPLVFFSAAYWDYQSAAWDPTDDSGAVQGYAVLFFIAALAVLYVALAFPIVGLALHRANRLVAEPFIRSLGKLLAAISVLAGIILAVAFGDFRIAIPAAFLICYAVAILSWPFAHLWLWIARHPT